MPKILYTGLGAAQEREMVTFTSVGGVQINYDRDSHKDYGTRGRPITSGGPVTPEFFAALSRWMAELKISCPWGVPQLLVTGGIKGDGHGRHGEGRAIDVDGLWWADREIVALNAEKQPLLYLAVDATLRLYFGVVLDFWYNLQHRDHWHVDDAQAPGWQPTRSRVVFMQAALNHVWGVKPELVIDGVFGPRTAAAASAVLAQLPSKDGLPGLPGQWGEFLLATAANGFGRS
jgi:hypothetical protein